MRTMPSEIEAIRAHRPRTAERAKPGSQPAPAPETINVREVRAKLLSVPVIFIALVRQLGIAFAVYPNRRDAGGWCFKFQRRFVLELDAAGRPNWASVDPAMRPRLEAALNQAVQLHAIRRRGRPRRRLAAVQSRLSQTAETSPFPRVEA